MTGSRLLPSARFGRVALLVMLSVAGCGEADRDVPPADAVEDPAASPSRKADTGAAAEPAKDGAGPATAAAGKGSEAPGDAVARADRSGPSRQARCRIDDEPVRPCRFTPLFGDGSFNIELAPDDELRVVVDGERGHVFTVFGPEHRVPLMWSYHRDRDDRACWVADEPRHEPGRICVY